MKIAFFEIRPGEQEFLTAKLSGHQPLFYDFPVNISNLPDEAKDIEVISTHTDSKIDAELITALPNLKLIATKTTGFDHIDQKLAAEKNITVANVPAYGEETVAEYAMALLLMLSRKMLRAVVEFVESKDSNVQELQGFDLQGKTLGVIGTGKIGQHLMKMAKGFDMTILGYDAFPKNELQEQLGFKYTDLDTLLAQSDIISLHVPLLPTTQHLINRETLAKMKKGMVVINTSRGPVIETAALVEGLQTGVIKAVGLDVFEEEKEVKEQGLAAIADIQTLVAMDNVVITPHNAFNTKEAEERILQTTVENIEGFVRGTPQNVVKPANG